MRCVAKRAALPLSASTVSSIRSTRWPPLPPSRKSPRRNLPKTSSRPSSSASSGWRKKRRRSRTISATSMRRRRATATTSRRCAPSCGCASRMPTSGRNTKPSWKPTCRRWECCEALAGRHFRRGQAWAKPSHLLDCFGEGTEEMDLPGPERRLAAVLAADMVGYSRLMEVDETGTLARLKTRRIELIDPAIAKNRGRIIKTTGDGMLVEFRSVADAVLCAAEIQRRMARRNTDVAPARWIQFRIGINLGDVIVEDNDIFGDGVNVAARLEMIADPGGICVSGAVRDQVGQRLDDVAFEDLGEQSVKNIARPIRVFRVRFDPDPKAAAEDAKDVAPSPVSKRPSIAVRPLANMSGDPEQEFFADGLTEDIITELSRFRDLLVISRNSTFVHKGKAVKVQEVAREFGVDYVLEGSVRKVGDRIRVTVQLIDAETDRHIWAERYDRKLEDIFAIQDEMTCAIVATLPGRVEAATQDRAKRKPTDNMAAYECVLTARVLHHRSIREDNAEAQRLLDRALALDPNYAHAHAWKACVLGQTWLYEWCADRDATLQQVAAELETALALDDNDSDVHRILAALNLTREEHEQAADDPQQ